MSGADSFIRTLAPCVCVADNPLVLIDPFGLNEAGNNREKLVSIEGIYSAYSGFDRDCLALSIELR